MVTIHTSCSNNQKVCIHICWFCTNLRVTAIISLNGINKLIFVMVKCDVLFEVQNKFLNITWTNFGFKGLTQFFYLESFS
jgi:hypothetical protein